MRLAAPLVGVGAQTEEGEGEVVVAAARTVAAEPGALACSRDSLLESGFALCHLAPRRVGKRRGFCRVCREDPVD